MPSFLEVFAPLYVSMPLLLLNWQKIFLTTREYYISVVFQSYYPSKTTRPFSQRILVVVVVVLVLVAVMQRKK